MFFYESGERGAVVAVARILRSYQRDESTFGASDFDPSVLESNQLHEIGAAKTKTVTAFDNLMLLSAPVAREHLVKLQCGEPHQLITSRRLTSVQVQHILKMGMK